MKRLVLGCLILAGMGLLLAGCSSSGYQARSMDLHTTLVNPAILQKGSGDQALYRYMAKDADITKYNQILLDPVMVSKDGELDAETRENFQRLADNAYLFLSRELSKDYTLVKEPGPNAMRLQMVILDADPSSSVRSVISSITPIGLGMNAVSYAATGKQSGVGDVSMELKVTDSESGKLLGAVVDSRVGGKNMQAVVDSWSDANAGLQYWAKRTRYFLCVARKGTNCKQDQ